MGKALLFYFVVILIFSVIITGYKFSLNPFSFKLNSWQECICWIVILYSITCMVSIKESNARTAGYKEAIEAVEKEYNKHK